MQVKHGVSEELINKGFRGEQNLIIMQGVSGAGKSTRAKEIVRVHEARGNGYLICSADEFFVNRETGKYEFDAKLLKMAHTWCRTRAELAMELGIEVVIIDNTNTQKWEYQPYIDMAERFGYQVTMEKVGQLDESNLKVYANRNKHGVPLEVIRKQAKRFEK